MAEKGYIGKIPNTGNMDVKAPHQIRPTRKGMTVKHGADLRVGNSGNAGNTGNTGNSKRNG